ncbi:MAG: hypothetical protein ACE15F_06970 [bacterium]
MKGEAVVSGLGFLGSGFTIIGLGNHAELSRLFHPPAFRQTDILSEIVQLFPSPWGEGEKKGESLH